MTDPILYWNAVALDANRISHTNEKKEQTGPVLSSRALAIVHLAMYDAYIGIDNPAGLLPYIAPQHPPEPGALVDAAVAAAAHATLSALFPSQKEFFDAKLTEAGGTMNPGHAFGLQVARAILADRKNDPDAGSVGYVPSQERGHHKIDPDNPNQGFYAPFYGARSKGFAITSRHELDAPPFNDPEYDEAVRLVREKGIAPELMGTLPIGSTPRTPNETLVGLYWGYDGAAGLGTPPRLYNQIIRRLAISRANTPAQNAHLFALVNVAMADAGILAWDQKYFHNLWRPVVAIREHDESMGMATEAKNEVKAGCDSSWLPLGGPATNSINQSVVMQKTSTTFPFNQIVTERPKNFTPNFPAYPSGHATFGAAALHITRLFYGDLDKPAGAAENPLVGNREGDTLFDGLNFVSEELNGVNQDNRGTIRPRHVRSFPGGLWRMIEENGLSRVFLGVHWLFDAFVTTDGTMNGPFDTNRNIGGVPLGLTIAEDIFLTGMSKSAVGARA
ncbi:vanadium-dependent haloperoxidase [Spirosoma utsteinense]|uniref:Vanadium chloroperoxidase n=1 Tax=Spirosoma utsteinense TaxID=2585773 RepID=A0ABR6WAH6_9BACT|nr:vanadium-dependent haloperoxidase [Spirosoma utsteinense]MBC3783861.1 vanadium chloroperoxidase [Spirosoma utsteinense]MBC3793560.1 vanadium chloroperoxidase [Spirosoma utsteinense]